MIIEVSIMFAFKLKEDYEDPPVRLFMIPMKNLYTKLTIKLKNLINMVNKQLL